MLPFVRKKSLTFELLQQQALLPEINCTELNIFFNRGFAVLGLK